MRRREFIALVGGAFGWPFVARGQTPDQVSRVAVISPSQSSIDAFRSIVLPELAQRGFVENRDLAITTHVGLPAQIPELAREALAARPDVVVATSDPAILAIKAASPTVPIVMSFIGGDPIGLGLAQTLARPGGSVTGIWMLAHDLDAKRLLLLHEAVPSARRIAILAMRPPSHVDTINNMKRIMHGLGLEAHVHFADKATDYAAAFAGMHAAGVEALVIPSSTVFYRDVATLSRMALEANLPTVCEWASMAHAGCLIGHGPNLVELRLRVADHVARILRGTPPGDLPIEQPTVFEFAINLKTAKALGLSVSATLLARANEVIE